MQPTERPANQAAVRPGLRNSATSGSIVLSGTKYIARSMTYQYGVRSTTPCWSTRFPALGGFSHFVGVDEKVGGR